MSPPVPCLYPNCDGTVTFELGATKGAGTLRAHARCTKSGHLHYSADGVRYGTARDDDPHQARS